MNKSGLRFLVLCFVAAPSFCFATVPPIEVRVTPMQVFVDGHEVATIESLKDLFRDGAHHQERISVIVHACMEYERVRRTLAVFRDLGYRKVALSTFGFGDPDFCGVDEDGA